MALFGVGEVVHDFYVIYFAFQGDACLSQCLVCVLHVVSGLFYFRIFENPFQDGAGVCGHVRRVQYGDVFFSFLACRGQYESPRVVKNRDFLIVRCLGRQCVCLCRRAVKYRLPFGVFRHDPLPVRGGKEFSQRLEFVFPEYFVYLFIIDVSRFHVVFRDIYVQVPFYFDEPAAQRYLVSGRFECFPLPGFQFVKIGIYAFDRAEFRNEFCRPDFSYPFDSGDIVRCVAPYGEYVDELAWFTDAVFPA